MPSIFAKLNIYYQIINSFSNVFYHPFKYGNGVFTTIATNFHHRKSIDVQFRQWAPDMLYSICRTAETNIGTCIKLIKNLSSSNVYLWLLSTLSLYIFFFISSPQDRLQKITIFRLIFFNTSKTIFHTKYYSFCVD